ncbi:MAG: hypothetical protein HY290_05205 [Planctomycetia bacterium]|nr:hypothetical protein [Planctomycetia bacterium]
MPLFLDPARAVLAKHNVPRKVPSVSNYKVLGRGVMVSQVSGGVLLNAWTTLGPDSIEPDSKGDLNRMHKTALTAAGSDNVRWWWDVRSED